MIIKPTESEEKKQDGMKTQITPTLTDNHMLSQLEEELN